MLNDIQRLREATGAGVMDCKRALDDTKGDFEAAMDLIKERGLVKAEKKSQRSTGAGLLETYVHNGRVGVLLELRCETDFVARADAFRQLAHELVMQIAAMEPADVEALTKQLYIKDESVTIKDLVKKNIALLGENIRIEKFCRYEL